jgi:hypothetical protein
MRRVVYNGVKSCVNMARHTMDTTCTQQVNTMKHTPDVMGVQEDSQITSSVCRVPLTLCGMTAAPLHSCRAHPFRTSPTA